MKNILLEIFDKLFLVEATSVSSVVDAIKGRYKVTINYKGDPKHGIAPGIRTIEPYVYGLTKAGNPCIRAYQPYGDTASKVPSWKMFRLDRIISWKPTFALILKPAPKFNVNGDKSMSVVYNIIDFKKPATTNNIDGPKTQQQKFKQVGNLDNIDQILANREKEKKTSVDQQKLLTKPRLPQKQVPNQQLTLNKKIQEPTIGEPKSEESPIETTKTVEPNIPEPEIKDDTVKTQGDIELEKFKDLSKRMDNAPIMDVSGYKKRY